MNSSRDTTFTRRVATIAAIVLLFGQAIAAAHFHPVPFQHELSSSAAGVADSSCAICAAHLNSPATQATVPALDAPAMAENLVVGVVFAGPLSAYVARRFGRAPPASI